MVEAINLGLEEEMTRDPNVLILGQDVGVDGGVFRVTKDLIKKFGEDRVVDTPLAEAGILGSSVGLAIYGKRPVAEIQFSGFAYLAYEQLKSHAARIRLRTWGAQQVPMVVRMPYGGGIKALEHHSESMEMIYTHAPGLQVVIPSGPITARSLIKQAIRSNDPVVFMEPKAIYRAFRENVPTEAEDEMNPVKLGKARVVRKGSQMTVIAYGAMLFRTQKVIEKMVTEKGMDPEVIDLLTISPLDTETILESVKKTGRVVIIHEAPRTGGLAAEIIARINESALPYLKAPVQRVTGWDTPFPYFAREEVYLPDAHRIQKALEDVLKDD